MIFLKIKEEIELICESGLLISRKLAHVANKIQPEVSTKWLDEFAETFIRNNGGVTAFLGYNGFPYSLCSSENEKVVRRIPFDYKIQDGIIVSVGCGVPENYYMRSRNRCL